jgi:preprotein translocase subunit SecF
MALVASLLLCVASLGLYAVKGLNYGIDFRGGILLEIRTAEAVELRTIRNQISAANLGNFELQEFGQSTDILIRIESQPGGAPGQQKAIDAVKKALGPTIDYRRTEFVGPTVSGELIQAGVTAVLLALAAMLMYIWFRFEWQFGVGAVVALTHDVIMTIGVFALLGLEFNLSTVAAILTIAG